jgi:hypothetical protein
MRPRLIKAELISSTVIGKEWYLRQLRHGTNIKLPVKRRDAALFTKTAAIKNYDESRSTSEDTLN